MRAEFAVGVCRLARVVLREAHDDAMAQNNLDAFKR